jgi:transposase
MKCHTRKQRTNAVELYKGGLSTREVSRLTGINKQSVYEWAKQRGVIRPKSESDRLMNNRLNGVDYREKESQALYHYERGLSTRQVAALLDVSRTSVTRWIKKAGVQRPAAVEQSRRQLQESKLQERIQLASSLRYDKGWRVKSIAQHMGVWPSTVSTWLGIYRKTMSDQRKAA